MKKLVLFMAAMVFGALGTNAATIENSTATARYYNGNSFIFTENGITFAVYPDGEFDFYMDNRVNVGVGARIGNVGVTFNSGWDYNPFVQYDDYGAVIQVENIPIYYDYYGRVSQIGSVDIWYRNGRVRRVGGLNVFWNGPVFSHTTGFINVYNRYYVYRPYHRWFARPAVGFCNVWNTPYRRYYNPVRYTYYRPYARNYRKTYARIGKKYRYNNNRRDNIYRNDRRVAVREQRSQSRRNYDYGRSNKDYDSRRSTAGRSNNTKVYRNDGRDNRNVERQGDYRRSTTGRSNGNNVARNDGRTSRSNNTVQNNRGTSVTKRTVTRTPNRTTVTKREVSRKPTERTVTKRTTTYNKPNNRAVVSNRSNGNSSTVRRSASTERKTVSRSTTSRNNRGTSASTRSRSYRRQ